VNRIVRSVSIALFAFAAAAIQPALAADSLRPQVGKPLQAAQALMKEKKNKEALAKIAEADAVPSKTPYESLVVEQMRGAAAAAAGEMDVAAKAFEAVIASGKLPPADQQKIMQSLAGSFYRTKDYAKAIAWAERYQKAGGTDPNMGLLMTQSLYLGGQYAAAAKNMQAHIAAEQKAGRAPTEEQLQLLGSAYLKQNDMNGYTGVLEQLVTHYPKKEYWADVLARVQRKPGFSDRLTLDVYRLMLTTGNLKSASEYMEMAQLSLQAGYPKEAQKVLDQGYASQVLGNGADVERQKRLKALADKQVAEDQKTLGAAGPARDADGMINAGYNLVINGQADKGLALMQQGLQKGGLKRPEDAKLHLGQAYLIAGRGDDAVKTFRGVQGKDGVQDIARLFALAAQSAKPKAAGG
jgi:hypothetical protein